MRAVVIGAGVGGLAAARYLLDAGHEVEVHEQAAALRAEGASLILWPDGTGILRDLGVEPEDFGNRMDAMDTLSEDGHTLLKIDLTRLARRFGHPTVVVPRGDLVQRLADGLPAGVIRYQKAAVSVTEPPEGSSGPVVVEFADGTKTEGDVLIGADGHRSLIRRHLIDDKPATYTGYATWHGLTELPIPLPDPSQGLVFHGPSGFATMFAAGGGILQWVFVTPFVDGQRVPQGVRDERTGEYGDGTESGIRNLRERFGHLVSPVPELLEVLKDEEIGIFPHILHDIPDVWGRSRITLVGDAIHAVPPTLAQGVNQTLEDVWALQHELLAPGDATWEERLRGYEAARTPRLRKLHGFAKHSENRPTPPKLLRYAPGLVPYTAMTSWTVKTLSNFFA
jgi:FAD-dependent urate hydroxylase